MPLWNVKIYHNSPNGPVRIPYPKSTVTTLCHLLAQHYFYGDIATVEQSIHQTWPEKPRRRITTWLSSPTYYQWRVRKLRIIVTAEHFPSHSESINLLHLSSLDL